MAVLENIECSVTINDEDAESTAKSTIEKYIQSQADQNFAIQIDLPKLFCFNRCTTLAIDIYVDGIEMDGPLIGADEIQTSGTWTKITRGVYQCLDGKMRLRQFRFSALATDKETVSMPQMDIEQLKSLGEIRVEIFRANIHAETKPSKDFNQNIAAADVTERHVKGRALDTVASLDTPIEASDKDMCDYTILGNGPLVTFVFHYRSKEVLQQTGLLEKPLRERSLEDKEPTSLTPEEMLELIRRKDEVISKQEEFEKLMKKRLRQEQARHNLRTLDAIKRARSPSPPENGGEVDDEEVQIIKRAKKDRKIEIVELD